MVKSGGSGVRDEVVLRAANLNRSLADGKRSIIYAICSECLAPDDFFGYFLVQKQESNISHWIDRFQSFFIILSHSGFDGNPFHPPRKIVLDKRTIA